MHCATTMDWGRKEPGNLCGNYSASETLQVTWKPNLCLLPAMPPLGLLPPCLGEGRGKNYTVEGWGWPAMPYMHAFCSQLPPLPCANLWTSGRLHYTHAHAHCTCMHCCCTQSLCASLAVADIAACPSIAAGCYLQLLALMPGGGVLFTLPAT